MLAQAKTLACGSLVVEEHKEYAQIAENADAKQNEVKRLENDIGNKSLISERCEQAIESAENELEQLGMKLQEKRKDVRQLETELTEKSTVLVETSAALSDNQALLEASAGKAAQCKSLDSIEKGKTIFGGKVTMARLRNRTPNSKPHPKRDNLKRMLNKVMGFIKEMERRRSRRHFSIQGRKVSIDDDRAAFRGECCPIFFSNSFILFFA